MIYIAIDMHEKIWLLDSQETFLYENIDSDITKVSQSANGNDAKSRIQRQKFEDDRSN